MSQASGTYNPFDPTGVFKGLRDAQMDAWSKMMIQLVNSDAYAQATAALLDAWLSSSVPFRKAVESAMMHTLAGLNLPSRDEVARLAERLTNIEVRLDNLEAKFDEARRPAREAPAASKGKRGPVENQE